MKDALKKAGVDTTSASLSVAAIDALKVANRNPASAVDTFAERVLKDCDLLRALMKARHKEFRAAAYQYLVARAKDMAGQFGSASQPASESQPRHDRASDPNHRASQLPDESQRGSDRPVVQDGGGASHSRDESQSTADRSVAVVAHGRGKPKRPAPPTKIRKGAALAYATTSIFARKIGTGIKEVGEVTRFDVMQIKRRGMLDSSIADGLLEFDWPDQDKTPLYKVASEEQVKSVLNRAYKAFDALGITNVNR